MEGLCTHTKQPGSNDGALFQEDTWFPIALLVPVHQPFRRMISVQKEYGCQILIDELNRIELPMSTSISNPNRQTKTILQILSQPN